MFKKILLVVGILFITGCSRPVIYEDFSWLTYTNSDLGISFEYPDYYGETFEVVNSTENGESFYIRFLFDYLPDDPYLVYINGTTLEYDNSQVGVRVPYKGQFTLADYCSKDLDFIPYIYDKGIVCTTLLYDEDRSTGMIQNFAIQDLVTNSIERIFFGSFPEEAKYDGLQVGFLVPFNYVKINNFASAQVRGNLAVDDILQRMDEGRLPKNLLDELDRFEETVESFRYI